VKIANDEDMIIDGVAKVPLSVGQRSIDSNILVTPDLNGLIIGIDWMEKQGQFVWNFRDGQIKFGGDEWLDLQHEEPARRVRRVIVTEDTFIPASGNAEVNVRITHRSAKDEPYLGLLEQESVSSLKEVYSTRSLLPAKFSDIRIPLVNLEEKSQVIRKGTDLGILREAEVVEVPEEREREVPACRGEGRDVPA